MDNAALTMYQVDAFTQTVFGGNSAAVVPLTQWLSDERMQSIAMENNLSETAFVVPLADDRFHIRWFTPEVEVDLCGHATLAAAHVLFREQPQRLAPGQSRIEFDSLSGPLAVTRQGDQLTLDFPNRMPEPLDDPSLQQALESALNCSIESLHQSRGVLVVVKDEKTVQALQPDFAQLTALDKFGFVVTAPGDADNVDFVSRFFAPSQGVNEDPVTGSAHCTLAPYWAKQLAKNPLNAVQISQRQGHLTCDVNDERVFISGHCVTYFHATLCL